MTNIDPKGLLDLLNNDPDALRDRLRAMLPAPTMAEVEWDDAEHTGLCADHPDYGLVRMTHRDGDGDIYFIVGPGKFVADWRWAVPSELTPIPGTRVDLTPRLPEDDQAEPQDVLAASIEDYKAGRFVDFDIDTPLPRPEDVPTGEVWAVNIADHGELVGVRNDPEDSRPWRLIHTDRPVSGWRSDSGVTLLHRLTPETHSTVAHPTTLTTQEDYEHAPEGTVVATDGQWPWRKFDGEWWSQGGWGTSCALIALEGSRAVLRWGWKA